MLNGRALVTAAGAPRRCRSTSLDAAAAQRMAAIAHASGA